MFVESGAHVIVDVTGYFTGPGDNLSSSGLFVPVTPVRLMDTRTGQRGKKRLWPGGRGPSTCRRRTAATPAPPC